MNIIVLAAGGLSGLSGVHEHMIPALEKKYNIIKIIDTKLSGFWKYWNVLYCFIKLSGKSKYIHPMRTVFSDELSYNRQRTNYYIIKRAEACNRIIKRMNYDAIFQTGWQPAILEKPTKPHYMFVDFTNRMSEREYPKWSRFQNKNDKKYWQEMEQKSYQNASLIFTASDHTRNSLLSDYGIENKKVITVHEGVNIKAMPEYKKSYDDKIILFVGIDFERKGGYTLLKAFKIVKNAVPDAQLFIVGSSPDIEHEGITVKGFVNRDELLHLYKKTSIFVMPSICEPFGIVFLEAMANFLPCIGTSADAMPEIIDDGETGFLIPPNDHIALADKMIFLLNNENIMKQMGLNGKRRIDNYFTWDLVVERISKHIKFECR